MDKDNPAASNMPFEMLIRVCVKHVLDGDIVFQKGTCAGCGERMGVEEPNRFYTHLRHDGDDGCGHITDLEKQGGGYLLMLTSDRAGVEKVYGKIPMQLTVVYPKSKEPDNGPQESGRKDRMEGIPPRGACS